MKFVKDISYPAPPLVNSPELCGAALDNAAVHSGAGGYIRLSNLLLQAKYGAQMWVTKDVSDDLISSDIDPEEIKFAEVEWPEQRLELFFEDAELPTVLVSLSSNRDHLVSLQRLLGKSPDPGALPEDEKHDEAFVSVQAEDSQGALLSVTYKTVDIDRFAATGDTDQLPSEIANYGRIDLDGEETEAMRFMVVLLFKVLLLAGSEGHSVRRTRDKPSKKQGGKPGFKNRPVTDRLIVEYLPRHHIERRQAAETEGKTHKFNGRRGHWRRFRSDKFVNLKGKKLFIYPIPGPDGTVPRKKFVVRKISAPV
jgi:hypothetical protein